jgi:type VI secretion system protein
MPIALTLEGAGQRETRTLARGTLSVGRAAGNDWVLPDPDRLLSKTHCVFAVTGGRVMLTDISTNGVFINGAAERVPRDAQVALADGDELRLGDYLIRVSETVVEAGAAPPASPGGGDPLADSLADPFDAAPRPDFAFPLPAAPPLPSRPDPFDLADPADPRAAAEDDLLRGVAPPDPWVGPPQPDNADAPVHAFAAPRPVAATPFDALDIDALLGDEPPGPPPAAPSPPAAAPVAALTPAGTVAPPTASRLLAAFLEGAGVPDLATGVDPDASLRAAGAMFRAMVEGLRAVLISRAAIKNELRVEQTMLRARDNNALKFSVTVEEALAALLSPPRPGYRPPLDAVREAFADIQTHEMAVMAGVQTALLGLLRRFEPTALEQRLEPGLLGSLVPAARKARTWELFCATYAAIAREAADDFQSVFGREFARAYDAQARKS